MDSLPAILEKHSMPPVVQGYTPRSNTYPPPQPLHFTVEILCARWPVISGTQAGYPVFTLVDSKSGVGGVSGGAGGAGVIGMMPAAT